jgi:hypothetical protein
VALLVGVALLATAVVAGRELYILTSDTTRHKSWVQPILEVVGNTTYRDWMLPAGIAAAVAGMLLLYVSVRPRARTHRKVIADPEVFVRPIDVIRLFTAAAERVRGVSDARTVMTRRAITITINGDVSDPELDARVAEAVAPLAQLIDGAPAVLVIREGDPIMSRLLASVDRLVAFLAGLVCLAGGVWSIGLFLDEPNSQHLADLIDAPAWLSAYDDAWFPAAVAGVLIITAVVGVLLIAANLRRHRISRVTHSDGSRGRIAYNIHQVAGAAADNIEDSVTHIDRVSHLVALDRGRRAMTFTIHAQATITLPPLLDLITVTERDIRAATRDDDIDVVFKVHLGRLPG